MLTARQATLVRFIEGYVEQFKTAPTYEDMAIAMRVSRGTAHDMVLRLIERGVLRKSSARDRAVEIVKQTFHVKIDGRPTRVRVVPFVEVSP